MTAPTTRIRAFSLIELVIVVVIIGIIAAIAIPRMSRASAGAAESRLTGDLDVLRKAIELYAAEHGAYPTITGIYAQLTLYSNADGTSCQTSRDSEHPFGPYIRAIPALSVGPRRGASGIGLSSGPTIGWLYDPLTGAIRANTDGGTNASDATGRPYSDY